MNELSVITPNEWQVMTAHADALVKSGFLPNSVNTAPKAVAIMSLGRELGVGAWAALTSINVIQGKPTISPQLMLALINRSGQLEDMTVENSDDACTVTMKRKGRTPHSYTFSDKDAESMGLLGKDNWRKQRAIMRQWRSVAGCARVVFADVILGLYTPEEMGADVIADEQGNMTITALPKDVRQLSTGTTQTDIQPVASVQDEAAIESDSNAAFDSIPRSAAEMTDDALPASLGALKQRVIVEKKWATGEAGFKSLIATLKEQGEIADESDYGAVWLAIQRYKTEFEVDGTPKEA